MRIRTVGWLAAAAMTLTSVTVWSVTPPGGFSERLEAAANEAKITTPDVALEAWKFVDGSTLKVEARLGHASLAASQDSETYLYLDIDAPADASATKAAPVNLAIVIDRSGSMSGKRLRNAVDAARGMVSRLREGDMVSVIAYNTRADTLVSPTLISGSARDDVGRQLETITPNGDTCISCGIEAGMDALRGRDGMIQRMLVLSDGQATAGVRDLDGFRRIAERARDMGCSISSIGVDVDYNERIMSTIALDSNGRHYFVENASGLPTIFDQELQSLVRTVATNANVRVDLAPGVQLLDVFDRSFRREGNSLVVPMGSFTAAEQKTLLVKVRVPRGADGGRAVANVSMTFEDLVSGSPGSCGGQLHATLTSDASKVSPLDPLVVGRLSRAQTTAALREANTLFSTGDVGAARAKLGKVKDDLVSKRRDFTPKAAPFKQAELEDDFDRQIAAIDGASTGFAQPPADAPASPGQPAAGAVPPQASRQGRAQVRRNESEAAELAF